MTLAIERDDAAEMTFEGRAQLFGFAAARGRSGAQHHGAFGKSECGILDEQGIRKVLESGEYLDLKARRA
jgi:hypothetical protein